MPKRDQTATAPKLDATAYLDEYGDMDGAVECHACHGFVYGPDFAEECDGCGVVVCDGCAVPHGDFPWEDHWYLCPECEEGR